jgi:predicted metalloprotease
MSIPGGKAGAGVGGLGLIILMVLVAVMGGDPGAVLQGTEIQQGPRVSESKLSPQEEEQLVEFVSLVLGDTEATWSGVFADDYNAQYQEPTLVLFKGAVRSACGNASASVGPFYCPGDQKVYIDLDFFYDLQNRFGAPGDFAQAYVLAHEVGHHIQALMGTTQQVEAQRRRLSQKDGNKLSVMLELQADCYAGVWAHRAAKRGDLVLDRADLEEGLRAASAIGDDRLQRQSQGYVVPDAFTHGSSEQRVRWFKTGLQTGDLGSCDTFDAG